MTVWPSASTEKATLTAPPFGSNATSLHSHTSLCIVPSASRQTSAMRRHDGRPPRKRPGTGITTRVSRARGPSRHTLVEARASASRSEANTGASPCGSRISRRPLESMSNREFGSSTPLKRIERMKRSRWLPAVVLPASLKKPRVSTRVAAAFSTVNVSVALCEASAETRVPGNGRTPSIHTSRIGRPSLRGFGSNTLAAATISMRPRPSTRSPP